MSRETIEWLNTNTLIGFTEKRGNAWHHRKGYDNHYTGPVPVDDVRKRLFNWEAEEHPLYVGSGSVGEPLSLAHNLREVPDRKAIVRSDTGAVLGVFSGGYQPHQYDQWLVTNVEAILDDDLQIGSAGLLKGGAVAWVSVEVPDTIVTPEGVQFRPFLLASTSMDGSLATTYGRAVTSVVCDNTMQLAMGEHGGQRYKVRHSKKSLTKLKDVREALGIIYTAAEDFTREVARLVAIDFSDRMWQQLVERQVPLPDADKAPGPHKAALAKREFLTDMYRFDARVAPWTGTAFGALQAFNTYSQHENGVKKGSIRQERNMLRDINGIRSKIDASVLLDIMTLAA